MPVHLRVACYFLVAFLIPKVALATETVVLLHGIARTERSMNHIENALKKANYQVFNIGYPSTELTIENCARFVENRLKEQNLNQFEKVHFVTHSMGGLVTLYLLKENKLPNLGYVVMLGPPNQGSEYADFLEQNLLYRKVFGPAGQQLTTTYVQSNPIVQRVDYHVGVIAGTAWIDPISVAVMPKPHDGKVSVVSTHILGESDHIAMDTTHLSMIFDKAVINQILYFLEHGYFYRKGSPKGDQASSSP